MIETSTPLVKITAARINHPVKTKIEATKIKSAVIVSTAARTKIATRTNIAVIETNTGTRTVVTVTGTNTRAAVAMIRNHHHHLLQRIKTETTRVHPKITSQRTRIRNVKKIAAEVINIAVIKRNIQVLKKNTG